MENVLILGTGCAGLTAAIYAARANLQPLIIEGVQPGGQLTTTSEVENFPGFPEGVDGFELMDRLRKQAAKFGTRFQSDLIERVELNGPVKTLHSATQKYEARAVIVATGASPKMIGVRFPAKTSRRSSSHARTGRKICASSIVSAVRLSMTWSWVSALSSRPKTQSS